MVHQKYSLWRENFYGLPKTTYVSVLITNQKNFSSKTLYSQLTKTSKVFPFEYFIIYALIAVVMGIIFSIIIIQATLLSTGLKHNR